MVSSKKKGEEEKKKETVPAPFTMKLRERTWPTYYNEDLRIAALKKYWGKPKSRIKKQQKTTSSENSTKKKKKSSKESKKSDSTKSKKEKKKSDSSKKKKSDSTKNKVIPSKVASALKKLNIKLPETKLNKIPRREYRGSNLGDSLLFFLSLQFPEGAACK